MSEEIIEEEIESTQEEAQENLQEEMQEESLAKENLEENSEITEDDLKHAEKKTQDLTDKCCKEIDAVFETKNKEIMEL